MTHQQLGPLVQPFGADLIRVACSHKLDRATAGAADGFRFRPFADVEGAEIGKRGICDALLTQRRGECLRHVAGACRLWVAVGAAM